MNAVTSIEQRQKVHYAEVRRRLFHTKPKPKPEPPAPVFVIPQWYLDQFDRTPRWKKGDLHFDAHVKTYQWYLAEMGGMKVRGYIRRRCADMGLSFEIISSSRRTRKIVEARQLIMWEVREEFAISLPEIGRIFGGRDHTTCLWAIRRVEARKQGKSLKKKPKGIRRALQPKEGE